MLKQPSTPTSAKCTLSSNAKQRSVCRDIKLKTLHVSVAHIRNSHLFTFQAGNLSAKSFA